MAVILVVVAIQSSAIAEDFEYIGSALWSGISNIEFVDHHAVCSCHNGLIVLDFTDMDSISETNSLYIPGNNGPIVVVNDIAYLPNFDNGLYVVDITNHVNPQIVNQYIPEHNADHVKVYNNRAILKTFSDTSTVFEFLDISNPTEPLQQSSYDAGDGFSTIYIDNNYAFIASLNNGLIILDISDISSPEFIGIFDLGYRIYDIITKDNYAYIVGMNTNRPFLGVLMVVDISDIYNPTPIRTEYSTGLLGNLHIIDSFFYIQENYGGEPEIQIHDLTDPTNPIYLCSFYPDVYLGYSYNISGDTMTIFSSSGVEILDSQNPCEPISIGNYSTFFSPLRTLRYNDYLIANTRSPGIHFFDISNPVIPNHINIIEMDPYSSMQLEDSLLFILDTFDEFRCYNIANPSEPALLGQFYLNNDSKFVVDDDLIYLIGAEQFSIINISDLFNPDTLDNLEISGAFLRDIIKLGDFIYISVYDTIGAGIEIINVTDPTNAVNLGRYETGADIRGISVLGDYAYITIEDLWYQRHELHTLDISCLDAPELVSQIEISSHLAKPYAYDDLLIVNTYSDSILLYDISNPNIPSFNTSFKIGRTYQVNDILFLSDYIYIATMYSLFIYRLTPTGIEQLAEIPADFSLSPNYPNPFNASTTIRYNLPVSSRVKLDIYDILGRKVQTLFEGSRPAGEFSQIFLDKNLPSGIYFYKLTAGEYQSTQKMMLIK
ncbi:MAG: T9SS type A sorting domain-containing protein [candidate division Zixibacteria bacterium]|nr:T9SS type A sorting domain-containing protein [candidate division Zixibacteria bacterium]